MGKLICPLLSTRSDDFRDFQECLEHKCAWWQPKANSQSTFYGCAIAHIFAVVHVESMP